MLQHKTETGTERTLPAKAALSTHHTGTHNERRTLLSKRTLSYGQRIYPSQLFHSHARAANLVEGLDVIQCQGVADQRIPRRILAIPLNRFHELKDAHNDAKQQKTCDACPDFCSGQGKD